MLNNCVSTALFPYTADIYYASFTQDDFGAMTPTWVFDRTIKCQVVNVYEASNRSRPALLETQRRFQLLDDAYVIRTPDNVLFDGTNWHVFQETLITNILTSGGEEYWIDQSTGLPMRLEVRAVIPYLDPFEKLHHYRVMGQVSNSQEFNDA